jgi:hypothetical protein
MQWMKDLVKSASLCEGRVTPGAGDLVKTNVESGKAS